MSHILYRPTNLAAVSDGRIIRKMDRLLSQASPRCTKVDLWTNSSETMLSLMTLLASADVDSLESLSLSCTAFVENDTSCTILYSAPPTPFDGRLSFLKELSLFGVTFDWAKIDRLPSITHLALRSITRSGSPTSAQFIAICSSAPRLESIMLKDVGCDTFPGTDGVTELAAVTRLEVSFGAGPYAETTRLYNLLRCIRLPSLISLKASFFSQPSVHAFAGSDFFAAAREISFAGSCLFQFAERPPSGYSTCLGELFFGVVSFDSNLIGFGPAVSCAGPFDVRMDNGLPLLESVIYESESPVTEFTVERYHLVDFKFVEANFSYPSKLAKESREGKVWEGVAGGSNPGAGSTAMSGHGQSLDVTNGIQISAD
ncbi:hypothetical protein B0H16DRAFT_1459666 [Mycena metata]|uniref:Uncharacterized protein n=1 Tax=Mycena metata TaxID=1033252 RepID=A0AAD7J180_9AGAR|nr:hypothetical protein B0H16DRAFT_1459666 [Mycena metata]